MLTGLSICNLQEGGADNIESICGSEGIGVCWAIKVLGVLHDRSSNTCLSMSLSGSEVGHLEVDEARYFLAICCLLSELCDTFK